MPLNVSMDSDDYVGMGKLIIAEVIGYQPLSNYWLLGEKEIKNIYYKD